MMSHAATEDIVSVKCRAASISRALGLTCRELIKQFPADFDFATPSSSVLLEFFNKFWDSDHLIDKAVGSCAPISAENGFSKFKESLPWELKEMKNTYVSYISDFDWNSMRDKMCLHSVNTYALVTYVEHSLQSKESIANLIEDLLKIFCQQKDDLMSYAEIPSTRRAAYIISEGANFAPNCVFPKMMSILSGIDKVHDGQAMVLLSCFSEMRLNASHISSVKPLVLNLISYAKRTKSIECAAQCINNLFGEIAKNVDKLDRPFTKKVKKFASCLMENKASPIHGCELSAMLIMFRKRDKKLVHAINDLWHKHLEQSMNKDPRIFLRALTVLLYGRNHEPITSMNGKGINFVWRSDAYTLCKSVIDAALTYIFKNPMKFEHASNDLALFFLQLACNNLDEFMNVTFDKVLNPEFIVLNPYAVLVLAKKMLMMESSLDLCQDDKKMILSKVHNIILPIIHTESVNTSGFGAPAVQAQSLITSLQYSDGNLSHIIGKLNALRPKNAEVPAAKIITGPIRRWLKVLDLEDQQFSIFEKVESDLQFVGYSMCSPDVVTSMAVGMVPLLEFDQTLMGYLSTLINSREVDVSTMAARTLLVESIQHPLQSPLITSCLCANMGDEHGLMLANLYRTLEAVKQQLEAVKCNYLPKLVQTQHMDIITLVVVCLCSSSYVLRNLALKVTNLLPLCMDDYTLRNLLSSRESVIARRGRKAAIRMITDKKVENSKLASLVFDVVAESKCNGLYQSYLGALSNEWSYVSNEWLDYDTVIKQISRLLKRRAGTDDPLLYANMFVFIGNSSRINVDKMKQIEDMWNKKDKEMKHSDEMKVNIREAMFTHLKHNVVKTMFTGDLESFAVLPCSVALRKFVQSKKFTTSAIDEALKMIYKIMDHMFVREYVKHEVGSKIRRDQVPPEDVRILSNVMISMIIIFNAMFEQNAEIPASPFLLKPTYDNKFSFENQDKWFILLANMSEDFPLARDALASLFAVCEPDDSVVTFMFREVQLLTQKSKVHLLTRYIMLLTSQYLTLAVAGDNSFFLAICAMFREVTNGEAEYLAWSPEEHSDASNDFVTSIMSRIGSILALAFFHMSHDDSELVKPASVLFLNLLIASRNIMGPNPAWTKIFAQLNHISTMAGNKLVGLLGNAFCALSEVLSDVYSFCGEQFVSTMFTLLINTSDNSVLVKTVVPWLSSFRMDVNSMGVLRDTHPKFRCFSVMEFVEQITLLENPLFVIDGLLDYSSEDDVLAYILVYVLSVSDATYERKMLIVGSIMEKKPRETLRFLVSWLSFSTWFYYNVQLCHHEHTSSSEDPLSTLNSSKAVSFMLTASSDPESAYRTVKYFTLKFIQQKLATHRHYFSECEDLLLCWSLVNVNHDEETAKVLKMILPTFDECEDGAVRSYMYSFSETGRKNIGTNLLSWGTMCGVLPLASRGLRFYGNVMWPCDTSVVNAVMNSVIDVCNMLSDLDDISGVTHVTKKDPFFKGIDSPADAEDAVRYVIAGLEILTKCVDRCVDVPHRLLLLGVSLVDWYDSNVTTAALKLVLACLNDHSMVMFLSQRPIDDFLNRLANKVLTKDSACIAYEIICTVIKLGIGMFLWNSGNHASAAAVLLLGLKSLMSDKQSLSLDAFQELSKELPGVEFDPQFTKTLVSGVGTHELNIVVRIFSIIWSACSDRDSSSLMTTCSLLLDIPEIPEEIFSEISQIASADQISGNAIPNHMFLMKISKLANVKRLQASDKLFARFPRIRVQKQRSERSQSEGNTFLKVSKFVPMYMHAPAFKLCPTNSANESAVLRVKALPMSDWEEMLFRTQMNLTNIFSIGHFEVGNKEIIEFLTSLNDTRMKRGSLVSLSAPVDTKSRMGTFECVSNDMFMPGDGFVNSLGTDLISKFLFNFN